MKRTATLIDGFMNRIEVLNGSVDKDTFIKNVSDLLNLRSKKRWVIKTIQDCPEYINECLWSDINSYRVLAEDPKDRTLIAVEIQKRFIRSIEYFGDQPDMAKKEYPYPARVYLFKFSKRGNYIKKQLMNSSQTDIQKNGKSRPQFYSEKSGHRSNICHYYYDTGF